MSDKKKYNPHWTAFLKLELFRLNSKYEFQELTASEQQRAGFINQVLLILEKDPTAVWVKADFTPLFDAWRSDLQKNINKQNAQATVQKMAVVEQLKQYFKI